LFDAFIVEVPAQLAERAPEEVDTFGGAVLGQAGVVEFRLHVPGAEAEVEPVA
jgi:hypothetical protein